MCIVINVLYSLLQLLHVVFVKMFNLVVKIFYHTGPITVSDANSNILTIPTPRLNILKILVRNKFKFTVFRLLKMSLLGNNGIDYDNYSQTDLCKSKGNFKRTCQSLKLN